MDSTLHRGVERREWYVDETSWSLYPIQPSPMMTSLRLSMREGVDSYVLGRYQRCHPAHRKLALRSRACQQGGGPTQGCSGGARSHRNILSAHPASGRCTFDRPGCSRPHGRSLRTQRNRDFGSIPRCGISTCLGRYRGRSGIRRSSSTVGFGRSRLDTALS